MLIYAVLAFCGGKLKAFAGLTEAIIGKLFGLTG
jgi:succinate-acetate transporter protein